MAPKEAFILCGRCGIAITVPETGDVKPWLIAHDKVCKLAEATVSTGPVEKVKTKRLKKKVEPAPAEEAPLPGEPVEESVETKRVRKALEFTAQVLGSFKPRP